MIGLVLGLLSGVSFAFGNIFLRKGMYRSGESFSPVAISLFLGTILFSIPLLISGEFKQLASLSWLGFGALVGAGVIHFILGRLFAYISIRLIGANRSVPIQNSYTLFAALLGVLFLGEPLTITLVLALLLAVGGVILISTSRSSKMGKSGMPEGSLAKGVFAAFGTVLCWAISPTLIKIGLREISSPLLATFISYTAASIVIVISLFYQNNTEKLRRLNRATLIPFIINAIAVSTAQLMKYIALKYTPVSLLAPLLGTNALFIIPLSFLINREIEIFNLRIIVGAIIMVAGVFLIFWIA